MIYTYVDADTKVVLFTELGYDPDVYWDRGRVSTTYGCGTPTEQWFKENPRK